MLDDGLHGTVRYLTHVLRSGAYSEAARPCRRELSADGHLEVARIAGTIGSVQSVLTRSDALLGDGPPGILQPLRPSPTVQTITP